MATQVKRIESFRENIRQKRTKDHCQEKHIVIINTNIKQHLYL